MQNRYTGDIGDYVKYALLRALSREENLGVAWYLYPCEDHNDDGRHTSYIEQPDEWRMLDSELFDVLKDIINKGDRTVSAIENSGILKNTLYSSELLRADTDHAAWRKRWFENVIGHLTDCSLVFADPDNGLCTDDKFKASREKDWKRIPVSEVNRLAKDRTAVIYHHNSRFKGGHIEEIKHWVEVLPGCNSAYYFKRFSNRTFFILNQTPTIEIKLRKFSEQWKQHGELITY